ncbi:ATP-binding protein [Chloroflexales bacterium ZM16-3]|nr:ATP-binding protein [Chloroflexales bacterium ZM16-3]
MSQQTTKKSASFGSTKPLPPAGLRPPAPPWAKIAAWAVLLLCLSLLLSRGYILAWATTQPVVALPLPGKPLPADGPQGLARFSAMAALALRAILFPPGSLVVEALAGLGLLVIGLELALGALLLVIQTMMSRVQGRQALLVRVPYRPTARASDTATDLFRALHRQLPIANVWLGQAPWLSLTLSARPDEPVELGILVAGGTARQRVSWVAAIRKTIQGLSPDALVELRPDPLAAALTAGRVATWAEWKLSLAPIYPLRLADDQQAGDLVGPLVAALQPRQGVGYTEFQLSLRPRPDDSHLARGWKAAGTRRLLRLMGKHEYALSPDARALETKLAGPIYDATLRAVAVAADAGQLAQARAEVDEVNAVLGQYAARSGSRLQRWVRQAGGTRHISRRPAWMQDMRGQLLALAVGGLVGGVLWPLLTSYPLFVVGLSLISMTMLGRIFGQHARRQVKQLHARAVRATPLSGLLWGAAWRGPSILSVTELAGLWHLPTPTQGRLVRWLPCAYLPPPPHAFADEPPLVGEDGVTRPARLIIGVGMHRDDQLAPVGIPLRDARQGIAFTAPPGVGKTQIASNLADQLRPCGYTLIDGKGDDAGNLVETMRQRIPLEDEARLVILDTLDAAWPVGINPLAGVDLADTGAVDQVLGQIEAIFARLDPETWAKAPRMKNYLRKATLLVLAGESHPTIAHVKQALLDQGYRERLLPACRNVEVRDFWIIEFPQIGEQQKASRDALVSRFDMLLDSELTRYLFNQIAPALAFHDAIAERLIVLAPLPHRTLGGLAGPVGMLLFQSLLRAAFRRPGSDLTRPEYGFIGDEFQVLVENCDTKDVRDALTQVRAFGIVTIIANQLHKQLGDLADYALTAISNRILLRTQEPDATLYARHYAESGITAADISGQEPREHQYAWIGVHGTLTRLFSLRPLPWLPSLEVTVPAEADTAWQQRIPPDSPTPAFDAAICQLMYGQHADPEAIAQALAASDAERWEQLLTRWDAIRAEHRRHLLAHPGCIPDTKARQVWRSRLRAARPRVLAMAEYARIRQAIQPGEATVPSHRRTASGAAPTSGSVAVEPKPTQQAHFPEIDRREPSRLSRSEPDDLTVEPVAEGE